MKVLVCGSRNWGSITTPRGSGKAAVEAGRTQARCERVMVEAQLSLLLMEHGEELHVIQGGATGADYCAKAWAFRVHVKTTEFKAKWGTYGVRGKGDPAGPIRNQRMIDVGQPDLVLAFGVGGRGTQDMITRARAAQIPVKEFSL